MPNMNGTLIKLAEAVMFLALYSGEVWLQSPTILTEVFRRFLRCFKVNAMIVL
jgi:hypothetical protein